MGGGSASSLIAELDSDCKGDPVLVVRLKGADPFLFAWTGAGYIGGDELYEQF